MSASGTRALALVAVLIVAIVAVLALGPKLNGRKGGYSVGYQIGPHYLGSSTWTGTPYALTPARPRRSKDEFNPFAPPDEGPRGTTNPPALIYTPPITSDLRGAHPSWWRPDGGTYGLPPAAERPDFWAGDLTLHTYHAADPIPPLCEPPEVAAGRLRPTCCGADSEWVDQWRYYGGPKGWNMSPYY